MKYAGLVFLLVLSLQHSYSSNNPVLSPRGAGMSNSTVSLKDIWSIKNNQAGLAWIKQPILGITYENQFTTHELSTRAIGMILPLKKGVIGTSISSFGYSLFKENEIKLGFAKAFGENISFGMGLNYFETMIFEYSGKKLFIAEAGLLAKPFANFTIGAHIFNLTRAKLVPYSNERVPSIARLGVNYSFSKKVIIAVETEKNIATNPILKLGIEYHPIQTLYLRSGVSTKPTTNSFGLGLSIKRIKIDVATNYHYVLGMSTQVGIIYEFIKRNNTNDELSPKNK